VLLGPFSVLQCLLITILGLEDLDGGDRLLPEIEVFEFFNDQAKSNCSSRRSSLKDEDSLFPHKCKNKNKTLDDILGIQPNSGFPNPDLSVTRVYRAEIPPLPSIKNKEDSNIEAADISGLSKSDILLGAILRTCERNRYVSL
jgi:hypothetical protein